MNPATDTAIKEDAKRQEEFAFLFAQLVLQQSNMAMMLMGKLAHPESGKVFQDVEAARLFIDQLEMLETKTRGNLSKEEQSLLKQTLMTLRLNYVQTVETPPKAEQPEPKPDTAASAEAARPNEPANPSAAPSSATPEDEEHRTKFSKKY